MSVAPEESEKNAEPALANEKGLIAWWAKHSIAANLVMFLLFAGGIWMALQMQKEVFPAFELDEVQIDLFYPGASPAEVEQGVVLPIEEAVKGVQGIKEMKSQAREGAASVRLELVAGTDRMKAFQDIDQAINRIRTFPEAAEEPRVSMRTNQREVMSLVLYGDVQIWSLRKLAEQVRDRLVSHPQITQVEMELPDYVTHVHIPMDRLREYDLTLSQVADRIAQSVKDVPAGTIDTSDGQILLRIKERKQWAGELAQVEIVSNRSGATVLLGEIAQLEDGFEASEFHSQFNQMPSVELEIYRLGEQSPLDIAKAVSMILEELDTSLPEGVQYRIDSNAADDFKDRLYLLLENGAMAIVIVLLILGVFLEAKLAFWIMIGMTISFVGSLLFLPMLGMSINMITMFAFLVALGIVVDDAIVVGENIYECRRQGMSGLAAAIKGAKDIAIPVTFTILTTIIAFMPVLFMPGTTGKFWGPLPVVVITVLVISLVEALFILPAHLATITRRPWTPLGVLINRGQAWVSAGFERFIARFYSPFLALCLRYRYVTLSAALSLLVVSGSFIMSDHLGVIMMPRIAADEIEAGVSLPVGITKDRAAKVANEITSATYDMFQRHELFKVAEGIKTNIRGEDFIDVEIVLNPPDERDMSAAQIIQLWRDEIGDIEGVDQISFEAERGPGGWRDDISVALSHNDVETLAKASEAFFETMKQFEATRDVNDSYSKGKIQFDFSLRPEGIALGLTPVDVGNQLRHAFYGAVALRQLRGTNEVEVRVTLPEAEREALYYLENITIRTPAGVQVPLMDIAMLMPGEAFSSIDRSNGRRVITVGMDVEPQSATTRVIKAINEDVLPQLRTDFPGITWSFEGSQAELRSSTKALIGGFALALFAMYSLLAVAFNHYFQPLIVLLAIPFGVIGAVLGHLLLGYDLSLISFMGMVALSGVVVNGSLIMVDYANKQRVNMPLFDAVLSSGTRRFRPIMLTTLTTFGGLTPIILETSSQAYYLIPMAISLGFGIIFSSSIILLIVPCFYLVLEDLSGLRQKSFLHRRPQAI